MKKIKNYLYFVLLSAVILLCCSCVFLMEKTGQILDGTAFTEETTALYRASAGNEDPVVLEITAVKNKDNEQSLIITIDKYPMMKLRTSYPGENGIFLFDTLEYLAGSTHGWNEFTMQLLGSGRFVPGVRASFEITEEIEHIQITKARIHRYDTRIIGDDALFALRNRYERVTKLAQWMLSLNRPKGQTINDFEKYWKPVLFPEIIFIWNKPDNWQRDGDIYLKAEDINWNTGYTERFFPEELRPVRNSGTLLRDWEEALSWIYLEYEWNNIVDLFSDTIYLTKIK